MTRESNGSIILNHFIMGQYHQLVNFDRQEIVHPHKMGLGFKQLEHTSCVASLSDALYILTVTSPANG